MEVCSIPKNIETKKGKKREKNSTSERSKKHRMRKKLYLNNLENKVKILEEENKRLRQEIADLKAPSQKSQKDVSVNMH